MTVILKREKNMLINVQYAPWEYIGAIVLASHLSSQLSSQGYVDDRLIRDAEFHLCGSK